MPLYRIHRDVGDISQEDLDAASFRAIMCAPQFPGLKWVRSYWDQEAGRLDCIYDAANPQQLEEHARVSRIPCDEVCEVTEMLPDTYRHG